MGRSDLPDLPPNTTPDAWNDSRWTVPDDLGSAVLQAAAARELATLVHDQDSLVPHPLLRRHLGRQE